MDDKQKKLQEMAAEEGVELTDAQLDGIAGGSIYHDEGDVKAHRLESFYVVDDAGQVVMRLDTQKSSRRCAGLSTSPCGELRSW